MRHSEGVSYHDGPSNRSTVIREDYDFLDSNVYKINSTGNQMLIRYYSGIEQPRVYGFLLQFECVPTASTILMKKMHFLPEHSEQDCFLEDNTIQSRSSQSRFWRIPGFGDRHYKKMPDSRTHIDKLPHTQAAKRFQTQDNPFKTKARNSNDLDSFEIR